MKISRNENCPCGSDLKYKNCCGSLASIDTSNITTNIQNISHYALSQSEKINTSVMELSSLIASGQISHAQYLLQKIGDKAASNPYLLNAWGLIAYQLGCHKDAINYFNLAKSQNPKWPAPDENLKKLSISSKILSEQNREKFILIKSWGYGFWSDVSHVLGQLLIAEITGRTPVIHWGGNSLYSIDPSQNAFNLYFEPISNKTIDDIQSEKFSFWPPKWNIQNIRIDNLNKFSGPFSKVSGLYFLSRQEDVVVSDFWTPVFLILPWIPKNNYLHGVVIDEVFLYLINKYLLLKQEIQQKIEKYYGENLAGNRFIAAHIRGSDKGLETSNLDEINSLYKSIIDKKLLEGNFDHLFLMTDDDRILHQFKGYYGNKLKYTQSTRTSGSIGLHYIKQNDKYEIGIEVIVDTYLASKAHVFIGNGTSNPSLIISCLKKWQPDHLYLLGNNHFHNPKEFLFETTIS
jgi:protein O-GlcNAc transferase